jgi:hypothetical protein
VAAEHEAECLFGPAVSAESTFSGQCLVMHRTKLSGTPVGPCTV